MSQLVAIFEKIKEDFYQNHLKQEDREKYKLIFSPFSTGFTYDDFLFLDSNTASENAHKYLDELLEFSQIANTIPREDNYWAVSDQQDYLFHLYGNIISGLRLIDMETLSVDMLYGHPFFALALNAVGEDLNQAYRPFYELRSKFLEEIEGLKKNLNQGNRSAINSQIEVVEKNLSQMEEKWLLEGKKEETEKKIIHIIKDESERFLKRFMQVKGQMETLLRTHPGSGSSFYLTSCTPNNLYKGDTLNWKKITMGKLEMQQLLSNTERNGYDAIMGTSELSDLEVESISFELLFVNVTRAWFDESILSSPFWDINVLNRAVIDIPRVTSKLVFLRNVDVQLPQNSYKNKILLKKSLAGNLGPFIFNKNNPGQDRVQLNSVNTSLQLNRATVFNVGSKLKERGKAGDIKSIISKKQHQFTLLAPRLGSSRDKPGPPVRADISRGREPRVLSTRGVDKSSIGLATLSRGLECQFQFKNTADGSPLTVQKEDVQLMSLGKGGQTSIDLKQVNNNTLIANLNLGNAYRLTIGVQGYRPENLTIELPNEKTNTAFNKVIWLEKEVEKIQKTEAFQLIGVISKEMSPFPNPIRGADYL